MVRTAFFLLLLTCCVDVLRAAIPVRSKTIIGIGGSGTYDEIVSMPCGSGLHPQCIRRQKQVAGCLAPFNEEQTLKLRGPMDIMEVGVYYPGGASWNRISYYNQAGVMDNIVFMGNYGRSTDGHTVDESSCHSMPGEHAAMIVNGDDFMCHGFNTSYISPDGKCASKTIKHFGGKLDDTVEVNIMQKATCESGGCGFYRGMGHKGWDGPGGSKMFAVKLKYTQGSIHNSPALWYLHASVLRTANYHFPDLCNCRGVGSPGGCGELDIAEVVTEQNRKSEVETSIYSFKGAYSDQTAYKFERPLGKEMIYVTIFNKEGYIQVLQLDSSEFSFDGSLSNSFVDALNSRRELVMRMPGRICALRSLFASSLLSGPEAAGCASPKCSYMYSQDGGFAARIQDGVVCDDTAASGPFSLGRRLRYTTAIPTMTEETQV